MPCPSEKPFLVRCFGFWISQIGCLRADDGKWSFDELVQHPLPVVRLDGSSTSAKDRDHDRETHPTKVQRWIHFLQEVKERQRKADVQVLCLHAF